MGTVIAFPSSPVRSTRAVDRGQNADIMILPVVRIERPLPAPLQQAPTASQPDRLLR